MSRYKAENPETLQHKGSMNAMFGVPQTRFGFIVYLSHQNDDRMKLKRIEMSPAAYRTHSFLF